MPYIRGLGSLSVSPRAGGLLNVPPPTARGVLSVVPRALGVAGKVLRRPVVGTPTSDVTMWGRHDAYTSDIRQTDNIVFSEVVDYEVLPFTQGLVTAIDEQTDSFTIQIDDGYPILDETWTDDGDGDTKIIPHRRNSVTGAWEIRPSVFTKVGSYNAMSGVVTATSGGLFNVLQVGDKVALPKRTTYHAIFFGGCDNLYIDDLVVRAAPNMGFICNNCTTIRGRVFIDSIDDRLLSTNADGVHFINCNDVLIEIWVRKAGDDGFNFHGFKTVPQPTRNDSLTLTGKVEACFGAGAKMSGTNLLLRDFIAVDNQGISLHAGEDTVVFDSGPDLQDNELTVGPGILFRNNGQSLAPFPALVVADAEDIDRGSGIVAANIFGEVGDIQYDMVDYQTVSIT